MVTVTPTHEARQLWVAAQVPGRVGAGLQLPLAFLQHPIFSPDIQEPSAPSSLGEGSSMSPDWPCCPHVSGREGSRVCDEGGPTGPGLVCGLRPPLPQGLTPWT